MGGVGEQKWEVSHTILVFEGYFLSFPFTLAHSLSFFLLFLSCLSPCSLVLILCFRLGGWHWYCPAQLSAFRVAGSCLSVIVLDLENGLRVLHQPWRVLNLKDSGKISELLPGA